MTVTKKVYNSWAFSENSLEKRDMNSEIYNELHEKHKIYRNDIILNPEVNLNDYDVVIGRQAKRGHAVYNIIKNAPGLSTNELLLLCDGGNLCFGGKANSSTSLTVWED